MAEEAEEVEAVVFSAGGKPAAEAPAASSEIKWVEMPRDRVLWILAQKEENHPVPSIDDYDLYGTEGNAGPTVFSQKHVDEKRELFSALHASLQPSHDDFFEFQAWVRDVFQRNGCVMVPDGDGVGSEHDLQEEINDAWARFKEEYARDHADDSDIEEEDGHATDGDADSIPM
ncbi:hypothetical protein ACP70R_007435 [Stipagrostis hirtigluma subsp. patula]